MVDAHGAALYQFCLRLCGRREDAEDLFQDTFMRAFGLLQKWERSENPRGFLLAVACNLWKCQRRKYARRERIAPRVTAGEMAERAAIVAGPEDALLAREEAAQLRERVAALPEHLRIPILLRYTNEMSVDEIAQMLHIPAGTVKSRLHAARKKLAKGMGEE